MAKVIDCEQLLMVFVAPLEATIGQYSDFLSFGDPELMSVINEMTLKIANEMAGNFAQSLNAMVNLTKDV